MRRLDKAPRPHQLEHCVCTRIDKSGLRYTGNPEDKASSEMSRCQGSLHESKKALALKKKKKMCALGRGRRKEEELLKQGRQQKRRVEMSLGEGDKEAGLDMESLVDLGGLGKMTVEEPGDKGPLSLT